MAKQLGGIPKFFNAHSKREENCGGRWRTGQSRGSRRLAQMGYAVDIFEAREKLGGMLNLIPDDRLDRT